MRAMERITRLIDVSLHASDEVGDRHGWDPAAGSEGAQERSDTEAGEGVAMAVQLGWMLMAAPAREGMETLCDLLNRYPPLGFSPYPVARMGIETLGRAWWLFEPGLGAQLRSARCLTELLVAMRGGLGLPDADKTRITHGLERVAEAADRFGLRVTRADDGLPSKIGDVHRPKTGVLLQDFYEVAELGTWAYADTSSMAHGDAVELFKRLSEDVDEHGDYQFVDVRESHVRMLVAYTLHAWWSADLRRVDLLGWHDSEWTQAAQDANGELHAMIEPLTA